MRSVAHLDILGDTQLARRMVPLSVAFLAVGLTGALLLAAVYGWGLTLGRTWLPTWWRRSRPCRRTSLSMRRRFCFWGADGCASALGSRRGCSTPGRRVTLLRAGALWQCFSRRRWLSLWRLPWRGNLSPGRPLPGRLRGRISQGVSATWPWSQRSSARRAARTCAIRTLAWSFSPTTAGVRASCPDPRASPLGLCPPRPPRPPRPLVCAPCPRRGITTVRVFQDV